MAKVRRRSARRKLRGDDTPYRGGPRTPKGKARALANLAPPWKPGQSGNPKGRPAGSGSIKSWIKHRLKGRPLNEQYEILSEELAGVMVHLARTGNMDALRDIIQLTESLQITEDQLQQEIERVFHVVSKHVKRLKGGEKALMAIARELNLRKDEDE